MKLNVPEVSDVPGQYSNQYSYEKIFVPINSLQRKLVLLSLLIATFVLSFLVVTFSDLRFHFFQAGIFMAGFVFGPLAGLFVGGLSSAYNGLFVINNPWIIFGNGILGFFAAYFYRTMNPTKAVLLAYAIQLPYLLITDILFVHMPVMVVASIAGVLLIENILCALFVGRFAPGLKTALVG